MKLKILYQIAMDLKMLTRYITLITILCCNCAKASHNFRPRFDPNNSPLMLEVNENTEKGFLVSDISRLVTDDEGDPLIYSINEKGAEICTIERLTGKLKLSIKPDREETSSYSFRVRVSDGINGGLNRATELDVFLYILDENDNKPEFSNPTYHTQLREDSPVGSTVMTFLATDDDAGRNKEIRYFLKETENIPFHLNVNTGILTLAEELDYEKTVSYRLHIIAKDEGSPSLSSETTFQVNVADVDDNVPYFLAQKNEKTLSEDTKLGTEISKIEALDGDKAINSKIEYEIESGDDDKVFTIGKESGIVKVAKPLDREKYVGFQLKIKAYELQNPASYSTIPLKITITDVNDCKPYFEQASYFVRVSRSSLFGNTIIPTNIKAVDDDVTYPNNHLQYGIEKNPFFRILKESGTLVAKKAIENSVEKNFKFKIFAKEVSTREKYEASTEITVFVDGEISSRGTKSQHMNNARHLDICKYILILLAVLSLLLT